MSAAKNLMPPVNHARMGPKVGTDTNLPQALLAAARRYGPWRHVAEDGTSGRLSYDRLLTRAFILARLLRKEGAADDKHIGLLLPTSVTMLVAFFGVLFTGRIATCLNFTAGGTAVLDACKIAQLKTILTSHLFVDRVQLAPMIESLEGAGLRVIYLEDMRGKARLADKIAGKASYLFRMLTAQHTPEQADKPAVILFTSGSEGAPKGVVLSHRNILGNIAQFTSVIDVGAWDKMFACLPMYHSFGLTVGALLPLYAGMPVFFYPSPLHYHDVPRLIRESKATLLLTTDTFLTGYAHAGKAEDFASLRYVVAGAEKLKEQTRRIWEDRFGKVIFEGYGVTETSPVISINTPDRFCPGSVGRILPQIDVRLNPVEGIAGGAELCVHGPNVMLGYMKADRPGMIQPLADGWHKTGDIVFIDPEGFLFIKGRIKRFAKVGGEMVSLALVEQAASQAYPGVLHAAVSVPHAHRGEAVVLLTERDGAEAEAIRQEIRAMGLSDLHMPRKILSVSKVPVLGSGKIDYINARVQALELLTKS